MCRLFGLAARSEPVKATLWLLEAPGGFLNMAERPAPLEEILPPDVCARLAEVKQHWDPEGLIRANHEVSLTPA